MMKGLKNLKITKQKLTAVIFVMLLFIMLAGMFTNNYDFGAEFILTYRETVPTGAPVMDRINGAIDSAESAVNASTFHRWAFIEYYGLAQRAMDKRVMTDPNYGALYKTTYGQINFAVGEKYIPDSLSATYELVNLLLQDDIPFLYVQAPFKQPSDEPGMNIDLQQFPVNVKDYSNANADEFLAGLTAAKVKSYDMRPEFWTSGKSQNELFFDTDHHWTIEGAFLGTKLLAQELNKNYGFNIDMSTYDEENFYFQTTKDCYLGSMGRRVGKLYGGADDFTLITPKFDTSYTLHEIEYGAEKLYEGNFQNAILDKKYLDPHGGLEMNRYAVYHGDNAELIFENHNVDDGKVLIIKDSFGIPVYSFLSLGVSEVRALDMRLFEQDVAEYAAEYKPDIVILMYNADSFSNEMFDFNIGAEERENVGQ